MAVSRERLTFQPLSIALLRTPLWPVAFRLQSSAGWGQLTSDAAVKLVTAAVQDDDFMVALEVASPTLASAARSIAADPARAGKPSEVLRVACALHRYARRAATRPTPFGLFAGVNVAALGGATAVRETPGGDRPVARVDRAVLARLAWALAQDPLVLPHLVVQRHHLLQVRGDRVVLPTPVTWDAGAGGAVMGPVSVRRTRVVEAILHGTQWPVPASDVVAALSQQFPSAAPERIWRLLHQLVAQQVLMTDMRAWLGAEDPLQALQRRLEEMDRHAGRRVGADEERDVLDTLTGICRDFPEASAPRRERLLALARAATSEGTEPVLHLDVRTALDVRLPRAVGDELARAAEVMWRLTPPMLGTPTLRQFHDDVVERYGIGRVVPLLDVLDEHTGLGPPPGFAWPAAPRAAQPLDVGSVRDETTTRAYLELFTRAVLERRREVVLDEELVSRLSPAVHDVRSAPRSLELYAHVVARDVAALDQGEFRLVISPNPGSHAAGATFARFEDILDPVSLGPLFDESPEFAPPDGLALHAALRYEPRLPRAGNISRDPGWHTGRISVGMPNLVSPAEVGMEDLRVQDVGVGATLEGLYLVHLPTQRLVRPSVLTMLNPQTQAPNAARLICELAFEHVQMWAPWDWSVAGSAPYMPRVRHERTVLWSATWSLESLRDAARSADTFDPALVRWMQDWQVPGQLVVTNNDQRLQLDLEDAWDRELLRTELRRGIALVAQELPGGEDFADGWLSRGGQPYVAEVCMPLRRDPQVPHHASPTWCPSYPAAGRVAAPGSAWLFAKLYLSPAGADAFLRTRLAEFVARTTGSGLVDRWFFIRYTDPDFHIRLRLHGTPEALWGPVLGALGDSVTQWQAEGLMGRWSLDAYDPEFERYGGPEAMEAAERFFQADCEAAMGLLALAHEHRLSPRDLTAVSVTSMVHRWGWPAEPAALDLVPPRWQDDPVAAWLSTTGSATVVPEGFRQDRRRWLSLIDPEGGWAGLRRQPGGQEVRALLDRRDEQLRTFRDHLRGLAGPATTHPPEVRIVGSLLHMHCNRMTAATSVAEEDVMTLARACAVAHADRRRHLRRTR